MTEKMTNQTARSAAKPSRARRFARQPAEVAAPPAPEPTPPCPEPKLTKASIVLDLLQRSEGATLAELVAATGWLPHTTRAHLTGLRKKGHMLEKTKRGDVTCYRIAEAR